MKCAFSADIHFHNWTDFSTVNSDGINSRLADILDVFDQMVEESLVRDCKDIYLIGDIFHSRTTLDTDVISVVAKKFQEIVSKGIRITILLGNHDISASNKDVHMLDIFRQYCTVIDETCITPFGENCDFYNLPYISDKFELQKQLRQLKTAAEENKRYKMLLSHNGLSMASIGPTEFKIEDPISVDDLESKLFDLCLFGHYHKPQKLADNVFYVGSPVQHNFGERGDDKGFWIVDTETGEYEIIPTKAPKFVQCSPEEALVEKEKGNYVQIEAKTKEDLVVLEKDEKLKGFNVIDSVVSEEDPKLRMDLSKGTDLAHAAKSYVEYKDTEGMDEDFLSKIAEEALGRIDDN